MAGLNVSRTALRRAMAQPTVARTWTQTAAKASAARTYATASKVRLAIYSARTEKS